MDNSGKAFISQFSTSVEDIPVVSMEGEYCSKEQRWIGIEISTMPDTQTKTEATLNRDEEGDWN
jgi:hypothetical protein